MQFCGMEAIWPHESVITLVTETSLLCRKLLLKKFCINEWLLCMLPPSDFYLGSQKVSRNEYWG